MSVAVEKKSIRFTWILQIYESNKEIVQNPQQFFLWYTPALKNTYF